MTGQCPVCAAASADWMLCEQCTTTVLAALTVVIPTPGEYHPTLPWESAPLAWAGIEAELAVSLTRQGRSGPNLGGSQHTGSSLPFDEGASTRLAHLRAVLVTWCRDIETGDDWPADDPPSIAAWLIERIALIRSHVAAEQLYADITGAVRACMAGIDRAPRAAVVDRGETEQRLAQAVDMLATRVEILAALPAVYHLPPVGKQRFTNWLARGRIVAHARTVDGWPLYRVGDVIELARRGH